MNYIKLNEVKIPNQFKKNSPNIFKISKVKEYVRKYGNLDKPVTLNGKVLVDGYVRYIVADMMGWVAVPYVDIKDMEYVVCKFDNNPKEYTWKNDKGVYVRVGDKVLVWIKNSKGENKKVYATVVNTFKSSDLKLYKKHKSVIKRLRNLDK